MASMQQLVASIAPPAFTPACKESDTDSSAIAAIDWEVGVLDALGIKLRRLQQTKDELSETFAGTAATPAGRTLLTEELDKLELDKAKLREKKLALLQQLPPKHLANGAAPTGVGEDGGVKIQLGEGIPPEKGRPTVVVDYLRFPAAGVEAEASTFVLPAISAPCPTVAGTAALRSLPPSGHSAESFSELVSTSGEELLAEAPFDEEFPASLNSPPASFLSPARAGVAAEASGASAAGDKAASLPEAVTASAAAAEAAQETKQVVQEPAAVYSHKILPFPVADGSPASFLKRSEEQQEQKHEQERDPKKEGRSHEHQQAKERDQRGNPASASSSAPALRSSSAGRAAAAAAVATAAAAVAAAAAAAAAVSSLWGLPVRSVKRPSDQSSATETEADHAGTSRQALTQFSGETGTQDAAVCGEIRKLRFRKVKLRVAVGASGLGLVFADEEKGGRCLVKGFQDMPNGKLNPGQVAGIKVGDTVHQLGGVQLGSYNEGIALLQQQRAPVIVTVLRRDGNV